MLFREAEVVYSDREIAGSGRIRGGSDAAALLREVGIARKTREHFVALYLDTRHNCIAVETVSIGTLNSVGVHPRELFRGAIIAGAAAIIIAHNHPSGDHTPSLDDLALTKRMIECGELLGVPVLDSIIVAGSRYTSITESLL